MIPDFPKTIYKTAPKLTPQLERLYRITERDNPGWKIKFYNDEDCEKFLKNDFSNNNIRLKKAVLETYHKLIPGAYKADLWRLCVIYEYGGVYSDATQRFLRPIDQILDFDKELNMTLDWDVIIEHRLYHALQIGLFSAIKNHPFLLRYIKEIIKNVKNEFYGVHSLSPTGPVCAFKVARRYRYLKEMNFPTVQRYRCYMNYRNEIVVRTKPSSHRRTINKTEETSYQRLWLRRNIYRNPHAEHTHSALAWNGQNDSCRAPERVLSKPPRSKTPIPPVPRETVMWYLRFGLPVDRQRAAYNTVPPAKIVLPKTKARHQHRLYYPR